ncbi:MAG: hypothetical protein Fues2KO_03540 [Fuerstiella sp.]
MVHLEVVAEQRKLKAALPLKRPVTRSTVAAKSTEQRYHMSLEVRTLCDMISSEAKTD